MHFYNIPKDKIYIDIYTPVKWRYIQLAVI